MNQASITGVRTTLDAFVENIPLGRPAEADEIAATIAFLASDEAAYHTGETVYVDGGMLLRSYPRRPPAV